MQLDWVGEDLSTSQLEDDELDRAVFCALPTRVAETGGTTQAAAPAAQAAARHRELQIRMLGGLNVSKFVDASKIKRVRDLLKWKVGPTVDILFFEIRDQNHGLSAFYAYGGGGLGVGGYWVSNTHKETFMPNYFMTSKPILVSQFAGVSPFSSGGIWKYSMNFLHMMGTPKGVDNVYIEYFRTGTTVGGGTSTTMGYMDLIDVATSTDPW